MATFAQDPADFLIGAVESRVQHMGRHLGEGADRHLRQLVAGAVDKLVRDHGEVHPEHLMRAHADLLELVDKAEEIAGGLDDYPSDLLGEKSYFPAFFDWFCPRYPFC